MKFVLLVHSVPPNKTTTFSPINSMRGTKNFATQQQKKIWLMPQHSWALKRNSWHQQLLLHMNGYVKSSWRSQRWEWSCCCQLRPIIIKGGFATARIVPNLLVHCSQCKLGFSFFYSLTQPALKAEQAVLGQIHLYCLMWRGSWERNEDGMAGWV